ncbi:MAG TPA: c-type cytochrome, partial [Terriglobales bacterium]|nr:c-type cytochrome [Terriglobales bacterium]
LAFWLFLRRGFSARSEPTAVETFLARTTRRLATPGWADELANPQPVTEDNIREGLEHFADHCAICHGNNGSGDMDFGRGMYPHPPDLRQPQTQQLKDGEIYYIIQNGIRLTGMPAFGKDDRRDEVGSWNLVLFIRHLPKLTPSEEAEMERLNPKTPEEWRQIQETEEFLGGSEQEPKSGAQAQPHQH